MSPGLGRKYLLSGPFVDDWEGQELSPPLHFVLYNIFRGSYPMVTMGSSRVSFISDAAWSLDRTGFSSAYEHNEYEKSPCHKSHSPPRNTPRGISKNSRDEEKAEEWVGSRNSKKK